MSNSQPDVSSSIASNASNASSEAPPNASPRSSEENPTPHNTSRRFPPPKSRRRRIAGLIFLLSVVFLILWLGRRYKQMEIRAEYNLSSFERRGLEGVQITWTHEGTIVSTGHFNQLSDPTFPKTHELGLPPGQYQVLIDLEYNDGHSQHNEIDVEITDSTTLQLSLDSR